MADPVEVTLSKGFVPPPPATATKLVVDSLIVRISTHLVAGDGSVVPGSAYTWESSDKTADSTLLAQTLAEAQTAVPTKIPS